VRSMLGMPFRVFGTAARPLMSPPRAVLSGLAARSEFLTRLSIALMGWAFPLCRWPFPRLCGFPLAGFVRSLFSVRIEPSLRAWASLQSLTQQHLVSRPQPANSSHGLLFPSALEEPEVHFTRVCRPATFRLQGLATLLAASSLRIRAGFVSHRQRSWDSPFGGFSSGRASGVLPPGPTHIPFNPAVLPPPKRRAGPRGPGFWVLTRPRVPDDQTRV
jgi:hypothetical protein